MKTAFLSTLILALSTSAGFAQQPAQCRNFEATIALQMTKEGCLSQIDLCTVGTIMSNEPALSGATWFFTAHGMAETAGLPSLPKTLQSYAGTVLVTAKAGTFTTSTAGVYETESPAFSQLDKIVRGTDRFSNSTGRLIFLSGIGRQGGGFDSHVRGELCVSDTGSGMDAEFVRHKLFRAFVTTKGAEGMGIGAFQAREYVRLLGGEVEVQSRPGHGTTFSINLPLETSRTAESA